MKLGEKYGDLGSHSRAVELLKKATELDPYFVLAYTALGNNLAIVSHAPSTSVSTSTSTSLIFSTDTPLSPPQISI